MSVTRNELMRRMEEGSEAEQQQAREQLGRYQKMRSEELGMLMRLQTNINEKLDGVTTNEKGVDQQLVKDLELLLVDVQARTALLQLERTAFRDEDLGITPPSQAVVDDVLKLTDKVARMTMKNDAIRGIVKALTDIAKLGG